MNTLCSQVCSEHINQLNHVLFTTGDSQTPDPSADEAGFDMQLSKGQHQQYDSQFQEDAAPTITGTGT